jgi:hypothetical protein
MHGNPEALPEPPSIEDQRLWLVEDLDGLRAEILGLDLAAVASVVQEAFYSAQLAIANARAAIGELAIGDVARGFDDPVELSNRQQGLAALEALRSAERLLLADSGEVDDGGSADDEDPADGNAADPTATNGKGLKKAASAIIGKLKTAVSKLWNLLLRLITPKEWKISGEISGGIPALGMATATVEITFG